MTPRLNSCFAWIKGKLHRPKLERDPHTHDYTKRFWGHDYTIRAVEGNTIQITGWGGGLAVGDWLLLPNGISTSRYRLTKLLYYTNVPDMWRAEAEHDPRPEAGN